MGSILRRLSSEGFRVFFLSAVLFGALAGAVWLVWLLALQRGEMLELAGGALLPSQWHAHEMIFGYAAAAVGGFFLTAVPNWTGAAAARQGFIAAVAMLWLLGRLAVWGSGVLPAALVMVLDQLFVPVLALKVLLQLIKRPKVPNLAFLIFLIGLWTGNLLVHLDWMGAADSLDLGLRVGLLALCGMIAVLGGRVTPAFTRNAMKRAGVPEAQWPRSPDWADKAVLILALLLPWMASLPRLAGAAALVLAALQLCRQWNWRGGWTLGQPILWSLHLGMGFLIFGLAAWGAAQFGIGQELAALHLLGIGCVGGMTAAVMSRASLGHTGRALEASRPMAWAYALIALAAVLRFSATDIGVLTLAAGLAWTSAFVLLFVSLWPILAAPRVGR